MEVATTIATAGLNKKIFDFSLSCRTVKFWAKVKETFENIFANYEPETLKKYWMYLDKVKSIKVFNRIVERNASLFKTKNTKYIFNKSFGYHQDLCFKATRRN